MSDAITQDDPRGERRLYRDRENGYLTGVCAGVADYAGVDPLVVRAGFLVGLYLFFWITLAVYAAAALVLRPKPLTWYGRSRETDFWRRHRTSPWSHS